MSYKREITTLGRGGSDTTAVALAAALQADRCEIYSDVDGVYSADPRVVEGARHLPELDHAMLQEMAEGGAKVICAQAVEWARKRNITIHARSTFERGKETVIVPAGRAKPGARAVCAEQKLLYITWAGPAPSAVLAGLRDLGLTFKDLAQAPNGGNAIVPLLNVPSADAAARALASRLPENTITEGVASVSIVGDGLADSAAHLESFLAALTGAGVAPLALLGGPLRLGAIVRADDAAAAQRAVHAAFIG
jgi:aspartate kinase